MRSIIRGFIAATLRVTLGTILAGGFIAGATTMAGAAGERLMIVPNSPDGFAAISQSRARVVTTYDEFTLVEVDARRVRGLIDAGGELRDDMRRVRIGDHTFDPTVAGPYLQAKTGHAPRLASKGGVGLLIVQYVGPLKSEWVEAVSGSGVEVVSYMAQNAQLVAGDSGALAALNQLATRRSFIRAVIPFDPSAKKRRGLHRAGEAQVVVSTVAGRAGNAARAEIARLSTPRAEATKVAGFVNQRVMVDAKNIDVIAELGGVVAIEPWVEPKLLDERAATIVAGRLDAGFSPVLGNGYKRFLQQNGFKANNPIVIDITDEGLDKGVVPVPAGSHPAFFQRGDTSAASRILYAQNPTVDSNARDCGGHGTNVGSIAAGYSDLTGAGDHDAEGFHYALGISPFAHLGATKIFNCAGNFDVPVPFSTLRSFSYSQGARIANNSWGASVGGAYNTNSQIFDGLVRDAQPGVNGNQQFAEIFSAGNSGPGVNTIGAPGTAKNVLTVGASENVRSIGASDGCGVPDTGADSARDIINFSSRGPTDDGRIKPDIVAPGTHVSGAQPQTGADYNGSGTCNPQFPAGSMLYNLVSGTSQAAPEVTGLSSLVFAWYRENFGNGHKYPSPAMNKALIINTATDLAGGNDGAGGLNAPVPTQIQGWGRVNLGEILASTSRDLVDQTQILRTTGKSVSRFYKVAQGNKPLRVTLAWTDPPGPTVGNSFVNDLDLEVTAGGRVFKGNVFSGGHSVTGGTADPRNNVENVFLPPGIKGPVKVRVIGSNIAGDGVPGNSATADQDYALVVSNVTAPVDNLPVLIDTRDTLTPAGDGDRFLEPGEAFTLGVKLKNVGSATATSVSGVLSSLDGKVSILQPNGAWPNIAVNGSASNTTLFQGKLRNSASCGEPVELQVALASNGGTTNLPITVPTGSISRPRTFDSTDVPKAIPDNTPAGVTSVVNAVGGGRISSVDVTIGSITHTFDSDLQIELTSPDGTTVRLFDRNGSSGDNLTNTVFSDSASVAISAGAAPFTGSFIPAQPLSAFKGQHAGGTWTLTVRDLAGADTGTLNNWGLSISRITCN